MLVCSFTVQYTFTENEVEQAVEGGEGDLDPTSVALAKMAAEVRDCLADRFGIVEVEAWADFDELLGDEEDDDAPG